MKRSFVIFFIFCFVGCSEIRDDISVMTFNIRYGTAKDGPNSWENRKSILLDCLEKYKPDILAVQESMDFQIDAINQYMPGWKAIGVGRYHNFQEPSRPHESMGGESCKILFDSSKFELIEQGTYWHSDTPDVPASKTWGNSLPRITTWGIFRNVESRKEFVVMNTHCHSGEPYVSNTAILIMRKWREIAGDRPTILLGDFNLGPDSNTHALFCGKSGPSDLRGTFRDCWQELNKPEEEAGTGHGFTGTKEQRRIDWILVTPDFKIANIEIIYYNENGQFPSDHYPVMARLQCPEFLK